MPANLRVGLYNSIPDIGDDHFASYVNYIQMKWDCMMTGVQLELVTGTNKYDPYGNLKKILGTGPESFDLIETDMARSSELVGKVVELHPGKTEGKIDVSRYFKASIDAVKHGNSYFGFPTLTCGNFVIEIKQKGEEIDLLNGEDYESFEETADIAEKNMVYHGPCSKKKPTKTSKHARLIGGKIEDSAGWYLPYIYLDGVVDIRGPGCVQTQIQDVLNGKPNALTIERLRKFFGYFKNNCGQIDKKDIEKDIVSGEDAYFFGFSESLSDILKDGNYDDIKAAGVLSTPFGDTNYVLVFTDALVMNKGKYQNADEEKKSAMNLFAKFFTSKLHSY